MTAWSYFISRRRYRARIRQSTARKQALEECCGSVKYLLHPDASQRFLRLPFITLLVIMAGKRNAVEAVQKRKKENQLLSDCNSNRSRTIQMTVRVRSCRRRHVQSATIYFCLPTLPAYLCRFNVMRNTKKTRAWVDFEQCHFIQGRS